MRIQGLTFTSNWADAFPSDPQIENSTRQVRDILFSDVLPTAVSNPKMIAWSDEVAELLGLTSTASSQEWAEVLSGNKILKGMRPIATRYGGHQFGSWAGQLGDGRAITLGELSNNLGQSFELQLKGAGPTPYSRFADGRAVLRSSLREFVVSEAMHHLGISTTRALSLVDTGDEVVRDMFYNGRPKVERGAIVCRVAPTFLRFGHFQILQAHGELDLLQRLVDDSIDRYFSNLKSLAKQAKHREWFAEICRQTANMIVNWMRVGFVHGVMNTDNMSILGATIDYGPFGFLEPFQADWTPNTTDAASRRYCYANQPHIAMWNLQAFAHALMAAMPQDDLTAGLEIYRDTYQSGFESMMAHKLGLSDQSHREIAELTSRFIETYKPDWTLFFANLETLSLETTSSAVVETNIKILKSSIYKILDDQDPLLKEFHDLYVLLRRRDQQQEMNCFEQMLSANPIVVPRNYLLHQAIEAANEGRYETLQELMIACKTPYDRKWSKTKFAQLRPEWAADTPGCSTLSCSS